MVGLQRIWMLCLLVIAGGGPLPLWLHHSVCHEHSCLSHAVPVTSNAHGGCCSHDHAADHAADHAVNFGGKAKQAAQQWHSHSDSHDDCVVCYTLSQLTTAPRANDSLVGQHLAQFVGQARDSQASLEILSAYSSRGPPAVDPVAYV